MNERDEKYLRMAIGLAHEALAAGDPPYGAVLVSKEQQVLAEAQNTTVTDNDITAHPELKLARWAAQTLAAASAHSTTLYTSCQPCAMCANAVARAHLHRVVYALGWDELEALKPPGYQNPDAIKVAEDGPALYDLARVPIQMHFGISQPNLIGEDASGSPASDVPQPQRRG